MQSKSAETLFKSLLALGRFSCILLVQYPNKPLAASKLFKVQKGRLCRHLFCFSHTFRVLRLPRRSSFLLDSIPRRPACTAVRTQKNAGKRPALNQFSACSVSFPRSRVNTAAMCCPTFVSRCATMASSRTRSPQSRHFLKLASHLAVEGLGV